MEIPRSGEKRTDIERLRQKKDFRKCHALRDTVCAGGTQAFAPQLEDIEQTLREILTLRV